MYIYVSNTVHMKYKQHHLPSQTRSIRHGMTRKVKGGGGGGPSKLASMAFTRDSEQTESKDL